MNLKSKIRKTIFVFCAAVVHFSLTGCSKDMHDHPKLTTGKQLFEHHCASCHKVTGKGAFLKGVPANKDTILSKSQIVHKIKDQSSANEKMPSFPKMSAYEAAKISAYLKNI